MKKLLILAVLFLLFSCDSNKEKIRKSETHFEFEGGADINVTIIDSCEYLYVDCNGVHVITHKGNCKFCETRKCLKMFKIFSSGPKSF